MEKLIVLIEYGRMIDIEVSVSDLISILWIIIEFL